MRILVISPALYPCATGGVEIFNYYFIKELAKKGHQVWVLTTCEYEWDNPNIFPVKLSRRVFLHPKLSVGIHILFNLIKLRGRIDIIHVPYTSNSPLVYPVLLAKKLDGVSYVITIHGGGMYAWKPWAPHKAFFQYADGIVAVSETIRKEYESRSGREIKVISPLIPFTESEISKHSARIQYGLNDQDIIILYVGSIKRIKGPEILLDAFLKLRKDYIKKHSLRLLYVGNGDMKTVLEKKVNEKGFNEFVTFLGKVPHEQLPQIYSMADIYVIPSLFEGTPVALLEAMFNGLAIVGANTPGINNLINHKRNGLLFESENSGDLAAKIREFVQNGDLPRKLGETAKRDYAESYSFDDVILQHIDLCAAALGNRNG